MSEQTGQLSHKLGNILARLIWRDDSKRHVIVAISNEIDGQSGRVFGLDGSVSQREQINDKYPDGDDYLGYDECLVAKRVNEAFG